VPATAGEKPKYAVVRLHQHTTPAEPGEKVEFKIKVTNQGLASGADVRFTDRLPAEILDLATAELAIGKTAAPPGVQLDRQTGELSWTIGTLENKDPKAKGWVQTVISIGAILGCFTGALLGNWLGRRPAYFLLCLLSLLSCWYLFRCLDTYDPWFVLVTGFVGLVTASFYGWLPLYLPELFPTRVRATGQGMSFNSGRILAAVGAMSTGQMMKHLFEGSYPKACAAITLIYVVGMVLIWFAPETKGKPLPD
jgi:uncharacterized repeat protein (TIGR01451 family)